MDSENVLQQERAIEEMNTDQYAQRENSTQGCRLFISHQSVDILPAADVYPHREVVNGSSTDRGGQFQRARIRRLCRRCKLYSSIICLSFGAIMFVAAIVFFTLQWNWITGSAFAVASIVFIALGFYFRRNNEEWLDRVYSSVSIRRSGNVTRSEILTNQPNYEQSRSRSLRITFPLLPRRYTATPSNELPSYNDVIRSDITFRSTENGEATRELSTGRRNSSVVEDELPDYQSAVQNIRNQNSVLD
ncbi:uncharacterized protein LOC143465503 isoform X2 [Clavelina lepadiformis]|uniref:Uncharacterized protein n=1 Tax=Clavelina lepadiformis TaxID=159417 RepID=A0ABP0EZ27_CLALP